MMMMITDDSGDDDDGGGDNDTEIRVLMVVSVLVALVLVATDFNKIFPT